MNRRWLAAVAALPVALTVAGTGSAGAAPPTLAPAAAPAAADTAYSDGIYVVQMAELPVIAYDGGTPGLAATKPVKGHKIDVTSPSVTSYVDHLKGAHTRALGKVGAGNKLYDYTYTYNGFAAQLTAAQAKSLESADGVLAVTRQETYTVDTSTTPAFLGLTDKGGLWDQLGGTKSAGENVVIGVIDSGIWPESLSFTDRVDANGLPTRAATGRLAYQQIPEWNAKCQNGEQWNNSLCNQKLIGARYYNAGQGGNAAIDRDKPWEFNSPRDYNGHGTHTSSTSGGNHAVPVTGAAGGLAPNGISGIAPRARISMYKALWSTESGDTAGGTTSDLVAAIDQAVADGVDVINYSISGSQTNFADPVEISFLFAANAGVFVATSAGNSGPTTSTVAHPSPWVTTVAAGTHNRDGIGSVTLGNGVTYNGASVAAQEVNAPLIDATAAGKDGAPADHVALCYSSADDGGNALDPAKVKGKIVLCDRGVTGRTTRASRSRRPAASG